MALRITLLTLIGILGLQAALAADAAPPAPATTEQPQAAQAKKLGRPDYSALFAKLDADGSVVDAASHVLLKTEDFELNGRQVEALAFVPAGSGPFPGLLLVPGYGMSARDWTVNGLAFASAGYACLAVSQPGFGKSDGPSDFVGPDTIASIEAALERWKSKLYVDVLHLGAVGYSRGAMAVALLATQRSDLKAVVLGGGIYDFRQAFNDIDSNEIKTNMVLETGGTEAGLSDYACEERSSVLRADRITASVLILHGDQDKNAPISQAYLLGDKLKELDKDFEIKLYAGKEHSIGLKEFQGATLEFLGRKL